jgi:rSAM/selenodomain-associated transferase 2
MAASIGFVIPVLNEETVITGLLADLRARYPDAEITVVDGGSSDGTVTASLPMCTQLLIGEPGRAAQMNLGASGSRSDYLFFLHADSRPGVSAEQLQACLRDRPQWGFCRVRLSGSRRIFRLIEWFMNKRSSLTSVATGDQMLFARREVFESSGGFAPIPLMEDVAFCKRLRRLSRPCIVQQPVLTSSRRWEKQGVARTVLSMWGLRLAYVMGVSPERLWRHYYGG